MTTNLKEIHGMNQFCGPGVLSALTGKSTDECAAVISAVSGRSEIRAVQPGHLLEALRRLRFRTIKLEPTARSLYGNLLHLADNTNSFYVIGVPKHVVAVEVAENQIYLIDNHSKLALPAGSSARLMQKVDLIYKVVKKEEPKFLRREISVRNDNFGYIVIRAVDVYENEEDNVEMGLGQFHYRDDRELESILEKMSELRQR